jgi:tRNA pseudouridine38-40 synthase
MRVKAVIAYDGSNFLGFQKQKSTKKTITYAIEEALSSLHIKEMITGSGRTDTGVHASGQVIHFDLPEYWKDLEKLTQELNRKLKTIHFKHISQVPDDFHARFSAKKRLYRYIFKTTKPSIFEQKYISYYPTFNHYILKKSLNAFKGEHDFKYFHKRGTDTHTTIRKIYQTNYIQRENYHYIYFQANGFLRAQVRMMIEAAMQCAQEKISFTQLKEQLSCHKKHSERLAPSQGLYLAKILY